MSKVKMSRPLEIPVFKEYDKFTLEKEKKERKEEINRNKIENHRSHCYKIKSTIKSKDPELELFPYPTLESLSVDLRPTSIGGVKKEPLYMTPDQYIKIHKYNKEATKKAEDDAKYKYAKMMDNVVGIDPKDVPKTIITTADIPLIVGSNFGKINSVIYICILVAIIVLCYILYLTYKSSLTGIWKSNTSFSDTQEQLGTSETIGSNTLNIEHNRFTGSLSLTSHYGQEDILEHFNGYLSGNILMLISVKQANSDKYQKFGTWDYANMITSEDTIFEKIS